MPDFLQQMATASHERLEQARRTTSETNMRRAAERMIPARTFRPDGFAIIAEIKRAAPSVGVLNTDIDVADIARSYASGGATAVSVLTEPSCFGGSLRDLREARDCPLPVMRKDFLVAPYQVYETLVNGADGVLLIAALLDDATLSEMLHITNELGMFALAEAFDETDLERAQRAGAEIIGVNCRNLRDLSVDFSRFKRLRALIDSERVAIAESGITTAEQLAYVRQLDYDGALIGSALMRRADPATALRDLQLQEVKL